MISACYNKAIYLFSRFRLDERGAVAITFGILGTVLVTFIAVSLDFSQYLAVRSTLEQTARKACERIKVSADADDLNGSPPVSEGEQFLSYAVNHGPSADELAQVGAIFTIDNDEELITVSAEGTYQTQFAGVVGLDTLRQSIEIPCPFIDYLPPIYVENVDYDEGFAEDFESYVSYDGVNSLSQEQQQAYYSGQAVRHEDSIAEAGNWTNHVGPVEMQTELKIGAAQNSYAVLNSTPNFSISRTLRLRPGTYRTIFYVRLDPEVGPSDFIYSIGLATEPFYYRANYRLRCRFPGWNSYSNDFVVEEGEVYTISFHQNSTNYQGVLSIDNITITSMD